MSAVHGADLTLRAKQQYGSKMSIQTISIESDLSFQGLNYVLVDCFSSLGLGMQNDHPVCAATWNIMLFVFIFSLKIIWRQKLKKDISVQSCRAAIWSYCLQLC